MSVGLISTVPTLGRWPSFKIYAPKRMRSTGWRDHREPGGRDRRDRRDRHNSDHERNLRRLYVLRHAKSSWDDPGERDHERPLAPRGRRAVQVAPLDTCRSTRFGPS